MLNKRRTDVVAKKASNSTESTRNKAKSASGTAETDATTKTQTNTTATERSESGGPAAGTPVIGDTSITEGLFASDKAPSTPNTPAPEPEAAPAPEPAREPEPTTPPATDTRTVVERRGPGLGALLVGGVVAAGLGYGAAYLGLLPGRGSDDTSAQIAAAIEAQSATLASLQDQVTGLASAEPPAAPAMPELDLSPVLNELSGLAERLEGNTASLTALGERVGALEDRPVLTGSVDEDSAAMAAALDQVEQELGEERAANAAMADELRTMAQEAQAAMDAAQAAIAEAEARAQDSVAASVAEAEARAEASIAAASAQAALSRVRIAMASGDPFADALSDIPDSIEIPAALAEAAASGVPTLEELQARFPAAARDALPVALREVSADGTAGDRAMAFLRGQFAGRAITPREGDDPDAVLSRAQAAVTSGDLDTALAEIASLNSEGAQAELADWVAAATRRTDADAALDTLATALDGAN